MVLVLSPIHETIAERGAAWPRASGQSGIRRCSALCAVLRAEWDAGCAIAELCRALHISRPAPPRPATPHPSSADFGSAASRQISRDGPDGLPSAPRSAQLRNRVNMFTSAVMAHGSPARTMCAGELPSAPLHPCRVGNTLASRPALRRTQLPTGKAAPFRTHTEEKRPWVRVPPAAVRFLIPLIASARVFFSSTSYWTCDATLACPPGPRRPGYSMQRNCSASRRYIQLAAPQTV